MSAGSSPWAGLRSSCSPASSSQLPSEVFLRPEWDVQAGYWSSRRRRLPHGRGPRWRGRSFRTEAGTRSTGPWRSRRSSGSGSSSPPPAVASPHASRQRRSLWSSATTLTFALIAKAVPELDPEGDRVARLREPVGYWNALALLADMALVLGLWLGTARGHRRSVRVAGGLLMYVATLSLLLTLSRAGVLVAVGLLLLWLALSSERLESGLLLVASAGPAVLVGVWAFTRPALTEDVAARSDRIADGKVFGALALVGAAIVVALVALGIGRALSESTRMRIGRGLVALAVLSAAGAIVVLGVATADAVTSSGSCSEVVNDPSRFEITRSEQPPVLVERGLGCLHGAFARGRGGGHLRDRPQALSAGRPQRARAAQRPAAAARGRWSGCAGSLSGADRFGGIRVCLRHATTRRLRACGRGRPGRGAGRLSRPFAGRLQLELSRRHRADHGRARDSRWSRP